MNDDIKIHIGYSPMRRGYELWARKGNEELKSIAVEFMPTEESFIDISPPAVLSPEVAQRLMDALWEAGVKPSGGEGHTAHIRALNAHLEDMRRLVFEGR